MGATHVTVLVRNPASPEKTWEGLFLVDTGTVDGLVPRPHLEAIGLEPKGQRVYGLADGSEVRKISGRVSPYLLDTVQPSFAVSEPGHSYPDLLPPSAAMRSSSGG